MYSWNHILILHRSKELSLTKIHYQISISIWKDIPLDSFLCRLMGQEQQTLSLNWSQEWIWTILEQQNIHIKQCFRIQRQRAWRRYWRITDIRHTRSMITVRHFMIEIWYSHSLVLIHLQQRKVWTSRNGQKMDGQKIRSWLDVLWIVWILRRDRIMFIVFLYRDMEIIQQHRSSRIQRSRLKELRMKHWRINILIMSIRFIRWINLSGNWSKHYNSVENQRFFVCMEIIFQVWRSKMKIWHMEINIRQVILCGIILDWRRRTERSRRMILDQKFWISVISIQD